MEQGFFGRAVGQTLKAALLCTAFCLLAEALFAVFIKAFTPSYVVIACVNWGIKCLGCFLFCVLCIRKERAVWKGMAAGIVACLITMLLFGAIGGGIHLTALYLLELVVCAVMGGAGGILGANLRKE
ncbi:MAG: hypothetical protein HFE25_03110 [Clostridia bacterium]|jgi:hypothetical protein|nr:hypothetical protein [Clostridia bacterium]